MSVLCLSWFVEGLFTGLLWTVKAYWQTRALGRYIQGIAIRRAVPRRQKRNRETRVFTLIRTSPAFGGATSTSSTESGLPTAQATAALHLITWKQQRGLLCVGMSAFGTWLGTVILRSPSVELHSARLYALEHALLELRGCAVLFPGGLAGWVGCGGRGETRECSAVCEVKRCSVNTGLV